VADIASGTIVLNPETFRLSFIPEPARSYFTEVEHGLLVIYAENRPNACFVISKGVHENTYAGSSRVALTRWSPRPNGAFGFPLFQTADATYSTRFTIIGRDLVGRGRSMGPDSTMDALPSDSIFAQRIGPPDLGVCVRAVSSGPRR
jgi:hypothetical protein